MHSQFADRKWNFQRVHTWPAVTHSIDTFWIVLFSWQSVMNRMHVISIPYSLMKVNPLSWIQKVHTYKGKTQSTLAFVTLPVWNLFLSSFKSVVFQIERQNDWFHFWILWCSCSKPCAGTPEYPASAYNSCPPASAHCPLAHAASVSMFILQVFQSSPTNRPPGVVLTSLLPTGDSATDSDRAAICWQDFVVCDWLLKRYGRGVDWKLWFVFVPPYSAGSSGEIEGHALVSARSEGPERHQPELTAHVDRSRRSQPLWVHLQILLW